MPSYQQLMLITGVRKAVSTEQCPPIHEILRDTSILFVVS